MDNENFIVSLKNDLIPRYYSSLDRFDNNIFQCVFRGKDYIIARYMLAVSKIDNNSKLDQQIIGIRKEIKKIYSAIWCIREIGLQIILYGENILDGKQKPPNADKFGTNAVIIQGIHLVDIANKKVIFEQSKWGKVKFGSATTVSKIIEKNIKNL